MRCICTIDLYRLDGHLILESRGWLCLGRFKKNRNQEVQDLISKADEAFAGVRFTKGEIADSYSQEAVRIMREAVAIDKKDHRAWEYLCRALLGIGEMEEAMDAWKKGRSLDKDKIFSFIPANDEIAHNYPIMLEQLGEIHLAEMVRKGYTVASPDNPDFWLYLAAFYERIGHPDQQIVTLVNSAKSTGNLNIFTELIQLLVKLRQHKAAEDAADEAIQKNPDTPLAWTLKGLVYLQTSRPEESIEFFQKAIEIDPDDFDASYRYALALQEQGKLEESKRVAEDVIKKHPENADIWNTMGVIYYKQDDLDGCESAFRKAMELDQQNPHPVRNLINILQKQGKHQEIDKLSKRLKELDTSGLFLPSKM